MDISSDDPVEDIFVYQKQAGLDKMEMTSECILPKRKIRFHDVLKRTSSLLGEDNCSKEWISESRSNFPHYASAAFPRRRPTLFVTQLDGSRRHNPQPRLASIFRARHGQHDVCTVASLLPGEAGPQTTEQSAYNIEFPRRSLRSKPRIKTAPAVVPQGILPNCRVPFYDNIRDEILFSVDITEKSPSTHNPNKYMPRRRRITESLNQHRTQGTPYGVESLSCATSTQTQRHFVSGHGKPLAHRRHVSAPPSSLTVRGFDGGAGQVTNTSNTMHTRLLPYVHVPRII
ncbi:uncharacterized protein [Littorina saxatilis]|uniref:uncharacterized protein isoform X2 n=1 Tax=Littorina saxatilis TaxID=31220 RepID=UPI0038B5985B